MNLEIKENALTPDIFIELRKHDFIKSYLYEDVKIALAHDLFDVVMFQDGVAIGMARLIGDGRISFIIKDFVVHSKNQKNGYGRMLMESLLNYIKKHAADGAYIGLMSTPGKESFYEKFGFIKRPNDDFGSGMVMFYEK